MNPRNFGLMILMFGLGLLLGILVMSYPTHVDLEPMVVAARDMGAGTPITDPDSDLRIVLRPKVLSRKENFGESRDLIGRTLSRSVQEGEPLTRLNTSTVGNIFPDDEKYSEKTRVVTISIDEPFGVSPYMLPGCRVDVICTHRDRTSKILLENVQLLCFHNVRFPPDRLSLLVTLDQAQEMKAQVDEGGRFLVLIRKPFRKFDD